MNYILIALALAIVCGICVIAWVTILNKKMQTKNKSRYDLREISFEIDNVTDEDYVIRFKYGRDVVHQRLFNDVDIYNDKNLPFKEFVKWCEEESE